MGICASRVNSFDDQITLFERNFPPTKLGLEDYEERVKRLVFYGDENKVTLN